MTQVFSLEQKMVDLTQGSMSVSEIYTKIKTLWDVMHDEKPIPYYTCNKCTCSLTQRILTREQDLKLINPVPDAGE